MTSGGAKTLKILFNQAEARASELNERARAVSETGLTTDDLRSSVDAGFFNILKPTQFGGLDLTWGDQIVIGRQLAKTCASTAWLVSVIGGNAALLARMGSEAQGEVWADGDAGLTSVALLHEDVSVESGEKGYRLTGRWRYVEAAGLVSWVLVAIPPESVAMPKAGALEGEPYFALISSNAFVKTDLDHLGGLRGVGVSDLALEGAQVPRHRVVRAEQLFGKVSGQTVSGQSTAMPFLPYWETQILGPLLGCTEGAYENYTSITRKRVSGTTKAAVAKFTQVQQRLAEAHAKIKAARFLFEDSLRLLKARAEKSVALTKDEKLELARDRSFIAKLCQTAAKDLVIQMGALGIAEFNPVQRQYRDVHAMATYHTIRSRHHMAEFGKNELGIPQDQENASAFGIAL